MWRTVAALSLAGVVGSACFGKFNLGVTNTIEPTVLLPGAALRQEINLESDGLLGGAIRQSVTHGDTGQSAVPGSWTIADNSDGSTVRLRITRSVPVGSEPVSSGTASSANSVDIGVTNVRANDYVFVRRYVLTVRVQTPDLSATTSANSSSQADLSRSLGQLALAGLTYDHFAVLPGFLIATNGIPGDTSRVVWHLSLTSRSDRTLTAESLFIDWPRIALALLLTAGAVVIARVRRRRTTPFAGSGTASW